MLTTKRGFNPFVDTVGERSNLTEHGLTTNDVMMLMIKADDLSYVLDLKSTREAQLSDKSLIKIMKKHLSSSGKNNTVYTCKIVEDGELAQKNN